MLTAINVFIFVFYFLSVSVVVSFPVPFSRAYRSTTWVPGSLRLKWWRVERRKGQGKGQRTMDPLSSLQLSCGSYTLRSTTYARIINPDHPWMFREF